MLTTREFAVRVRVTSETVRRWVRGGKIEPAGETPGGQFRFAAEQVEEALKRSGHSAGRALDIEGGVRCSLRKLRARGWKA